MEIIFGEWLPDQPDYNNPGLITATNMIPHRSDYRPFPAYSAYSGALSGVCKGYISAMDKDGNVYNYAGDTSALYRLTSSATFADASRTVGGAYATATDDMWEFAHWGEQIVATNYTDAMQVITMGQSNFAALSGSPPKARHMAIVRDFLVLGNVTDWSSGAAVANRIHWSGFDNISTWSPAAATQADIQDLQGDGGWVQRVIGGEYGIIFQELAIWRMTYVGSPVVFQFDEVERGKGTPAPWSVINHGATIFYWGHDDFYMFNGAQSIPIGTNRVYQTIIDDLDDTYAYRISAAIDPKRTLVAWAYPGAGNSGGNPNRILIFNWLANRWTLIETEVEILCRHLSQGYTLDGLDAVSASIDALNDSLDSGIWTGGALNFGAFNNAHKLGTFSGSAMDATIVTGEVQIFPGRRALVSVVRPLVTNGTTTAQVGTRNLLTESATFNLAVSVNSDGEAPILAEGRYHRLRLNCSGFNNIQGAEFDAEKMGRY